jgi:hypothetical protein
MVIISEGDLMMRREFIRGRRGRSFEGERSVDRGFEVEGVIEAGKRRRERSGIWGVVGMEVWIWEAEERREGRTSFRVVISRACYIIYSVSECFVLYRPFFGS